MRRSDLVAVVLSAGLGKRMKSARAKVLHPVAGRPMIVYPVQTAKRISRRRVIVVIGHQADSVAGVLAPLGVELVHQPEPRGTADAVSCALSHLKGFEGKVLILCGDTPLLTAQTLIDLVASHQSWAGPMTVLTTELEDPAGYGRVIRDVNGQVLRIVEERDADDRLRAIREINTGIYIFDAPFLVEVLSEIRSENAQREFYLTDSVEIAVRQGFPVQGVVAKDAAEFLGINSRIDLAEAERLMRRRINRLHLENGVTLISPESAYIDADVVIEKDVVIYPNTFLQGQTVIGEGCTLYAGSRLVDSTLGRRVTILDSCLMESSEVGDDSVVGPFAHLRPGTVLGSHVKVGNFVEMKKSRMGDGSKANHLTYLGDSEIGRDVNIGAGTITCNYDGYHKYKTHIGDGVFVGSDVQFIAPVTVGPGAVVAAGTTVTRDVPPDALVISRVEQVIKEGWAKRRQSKMSMVKKSLPEKPSPKG